MARIFKTKNIEDDESKIKIYAVLNFEQLDDLIDELKKIRERDKTQDDYIMIEDEDDDSRFEINLRFCDTH